MNEIMVLFKDDATVSLLPFGFYSEIYYMRGNSKKKKVFIFFILFFIVVCGIFAASLIKTDAYNKARHKVVLFGNEFYGENDRNIKEVGIQVVPRESTWTKVFDLNNEGLTEHNFQAYTYDFTVFNKTKDEVKDFVFRLTFDRETFLLSAWNGALEIHQKRSDGEYVTTVPDLREYNPEDYELDTVTFDGEVLIRMRPGDYFIYHPSSAMNAMEIPIKPDEGTTPGIIMYVPIGEDISGSALELEYTFHRFLKSEPLFWVSLGSMIIWLISLIIYVLTSAVTAEQIKKYNERHERDNEIIQESIETFTGFIDAKDTYTRGHSRRVAEYTKLIAKEMGYEGEELDRIYYVALLHDCGKIGVADSIIKKPSRLTDEEFEEIKSHTVKGGEILKSFKSLKNVGEGALYHHEKYDGTGYPEGKVGEDIPLIARMICVADSFDAMNSNRVYRKKLTKEYILNELEVNKGKQFDPEIADIFLTLIKNGKIRIDDDEM